MSTALRFPANALIDQLLQPWEEAMDGALPAYRNHVQRVYHLTCAYHPFASEKEKTLIAVAGVFHDIGIWSHHTLDYLEPSAQLAENWLRANGDLADTELLRAMVMEHHKLRAAPEPLAEAFRRADWCDVTQGMRRFGLDSALYRALVREYPYRGFHAFLVRLGLRQLRQHPFDPLPMFRW